MRWEIHVAAAAFSIAALAQTSGPQFEVASIKPALSPAESRARGLPPAANRIDPGRYEVTRPLQYLIHTAYRLEYYQKITGPDWLNTTFFQIQAKLSDGAGEEQLPDMLRALLAGRLKLAAHMETSEEPVYILTTGKDGPKLKEAGPEAGPASKWTPGTGGRRAIVRSGTANGWLAYSEWNGVILMEANKISMPDLVQNLSRELNLPLLDKTGLTGMYEISIPVPGEWIRSAMPGRYRNPESASDPAGVNMTKSLERLGLKLDKSKAPVGRLIVDHVEKVPTEN